MKELKPAEDWDWNAWFWLDQEEFEGEWNMGRCRYRSKKAVGRGTDGRLFLMVWTNPDKYDGHKFTQEFYEIDPAEYAALLDRAIRQGTVEPKERETLIERANAPFLPPWDIHKALVVYRDDRYTLGQQEDLPYLIAKGKTYTLTCHPYEPCLYITDEGGVKTAVHNAFEPFGVLESFSEGKTVTSITGMEYDAKDFCRMVEYAADMGNIHIDEAEKVFGGRPKQKNPPAAREKGQTDRPAGSETAPRPGGDRCPDDVFYSLMAGYPDCVIDYCIVKNEHITLDRNAHWMALMRACNRLMRSEDGSVIWHFDLGRAEGKRIAAEALFAPIEKNGALNYRKAFLNPPHGCSYTKKDFELVNTLLFPKGTEELEVYQWTTDWSEYFDEGHEWWGALCYTVYDKALDRFAVILASATD